VSKKKIAQMTPEEKRARDIRNALLLVHIVLEVLVIVGCQLQWWSLYSKGELVAAFKGDDPKAFQSAYMSVAALIAFFFTSYDLVTGSDIQWPPLLASAFALGCAAEVTYKVTSGSDVIYANYLLVEQAKEHRREADRANVAPVGSDGTAAVASGSEATKEPPLKLSIDWGLRMALFGTFFMVLVSSYLTFFARRDEP
jgi:hypothetical protein